jgi:hypothetical protein
MAKVNHWLDRKHQAFAKNWTCARFTIVGYLRLLMHRATYAVTTVVSHYRVTKRLDIGLYRIANIAKSIANLTHVNGLEQRLSGNVQQPLNGFADLPNWNCNCRVAHVSLQSRTAVYSDYIAFAQLAVARNAMHHFIID